MPSSDMVLLVKTEEATTAEGAESDMSFLNGVHVRSKLVPVEEETEENGKAQAREEVQIEVDGKQVTVQTANLQGWWGQQIPFNEIVRSGALVKRSDGNYGEGGGFTMGK